MDNKIKKIFINSMIGVSIMLLILGLIFGMFKKNDKEIPVKEETETKEVSNKTNINNIEEKTDEDFFEEDDLFSLEENIGNSNKENELIFDKHYEEDAIITPMIDESKLPKSNEEIHGKKDAQISKEVATQFLTTFYNLNGDDPLEYIEKSKKYMIDSLFEKLKNEPEQPTMDRFKRKYISSSTSDVTNPPKESIVWVVTVQGEVSDYYGKKKKQTDLYIVELKKIDNEFKVVDFLVNVPL